MRTYIKLTSVPLHRMYQSPGLIHDIFLCYIYYYCVIFNIRMLYLLFLRCCTCYMLFLYCYSYVTFVISKLYLLFLCYIYYSHVIFVIPMLYLLIPAFLYLLYLLFLYCYSYVIFVISALYL